MTESVRDLHEMIVESDGELIPAVKAGVRWLGYGSEDAAKQALYRGVYPLPVIRIPGRRPALHVRAKEVARWLQKLTADAAEARV